MRLQERPQLPPALLANADWWGTLAAARDLGSRGVPVTLASCVGLPPARWSRHVTRTLRYPGTADPQRLLGWLLEFGQQSPGHVLYPTSDEVAWVVSAHRGELCRHFRLYSPPLDAISRLLDKATLGSAAREAGLDVADAWCPADESEVLRVAAQAGWPLYVKPRTQLFSSPGKGARVEDAADLLPVWRYWRARARYPEELRRRIPDVDLPLVQASVRSAERIYTVDGFVDDTGALCGVLGCVKVLQRPRGKGPGICFDHAPVPQDLARALGRLFAQVGFYGVFDAEFIEQDGRRLLIDVNPRFYNHMAFEVERGLPLPWMAYLAALGERQALREAALAAPAASATPQIYVHRLPLRLMLGIQTLSGAMPAAERRHWRRWMAAHDGRITDPAARPGDPGPALAELALELSAGLRHPRSWIRGLSRR